MDMFTQWTRTNAMIKNDQQYQVAMASLKKFRATLDRHEELTVDQPQWVSDAHKAIIAGEAEKLEAAIGEYENAMDRESSSELDEV
jgi:hypothetical protein